MEFISSIQPNFGQSKFRWKGVKFVLISQCHPSLALCCNLALINVLQRSEVCFTYSVVGLSVVGLVPRVVKVAPACAIMISSYEYFKNYFKALNREQRLALSEMNWWKESAWFWVLLLKNIGALCWIDMHVWILMKWFFFLTFK